LINISLHSTVEENLATGASHVHEEQKRKP
jgi:hypothetical protein